MSEKFERPIINVAGEYVALGLMQRELMQTYLRWYNDPATTRTMLSPHQFTLEELSASFDGMMRDESCELFAIYQVDSWRPIGSCGLLHIDLRNRTAEFVIVIGEADARGLGYGTEATRLTLDHAFNALGLRNVMLRVYEFNRAGLRAYEKAGFREFGRRRQGIELRDQPYDVIFMDCLSHEFDSPVLGSIFQPDPER
jgi:RimJ/RimL family protein N-acetyltransferase